MRNRMQSTNTESYRTITGRSAQKAITKSDGKLYHRGHLFGSALDREEVVTIGYSSASKVWSNTSSLIPPLIGWCRKLAERIDTPNSVVTGSGLDHLIVGKTVSEIPADVIGAQWDHEAFRHPPVVLYFDKTGAARRAHLLDLDLQILREQSDGKRIRVMITGPGLLCPVDFSLETPELFTPVGPRRDIRVERGNTRVHLLDYLNSYPLMFYFADFSCLQGEEHFCFVSDGYLPLDPEQMEVVDWTAANVDITQECGSCSDGRLSIHEYLTEELRGSDADVVFFDHGTGEIADFLSFQQRAADLLIRFYHCKGSAEKKPGQRVEDVYEVCGQVVKSLCWINTNQSLYEQIQRRARQQSLFIKGDKAALAVLIEKSKTVPTVYEMVIVQPGIRSASLEPRIAEVIAAANDHIRGHCQPLSLRVSRSATAPPPAPE